ncbi:MAG: universal stress protein [Halolamina sp.]
MFQRILVPTDGSEESNAAVERAVGLAAAFDAELHGVYVVNAGAVPTTDVDVREQLFAEIERRGETAVDQVDSMAAEAGVDVVTAVVSGVPHERIVDYAEDEDVDLIVMGTHGRTGLRHTLLGSVAERVIRHSPVPVLVNKNEE